MSIHPHGIHCVHIEGWHVRRWCSNCRRHWEETCGQIRCEEYERRADQDLARSVILGMQDGWIGIPAEILDLDMSDVVYPLPPEPSVN
jgi:hypothetical protein